MIYDQSLQRQSLERHHHLIKAARTLLFEHLLTAVQDAQQLSAVASELGYLDTPDPLSRQKVTSAFIDSAAIYGRYDQIRIVDLQGRERIRVNHTGVSAFAVPDRELQDKSSRYYVQQGLRLQPGQVYLSPLDLNIEHGRLEQPYKPTLRLVRMMTNNQGEPAGLLILNLRAAGMLNQFIELFPSGDRAMLLNASGYWLVNPDPLNEWGWLRNQPELTLANWRPALWQRLQHERAGSLTLDDDLFSFAWIDIGNIYRATSSARYVSNLGLVSDLQASRWVLLVQSPPERWQAGAVYQSPWFRVGLVGLWLVMLLLVELALRNRTQAREKAELKSRQLANFRDLYENAPIGYITLTRDGLISNVNRRTLEYLGYQREELLHQPLAGLVDDGSLSSIGELLAVLTQAGERQLRIRMKAKNGDVLVMSCSVSSRSADEPTLEVGRVSMQNVSHQARLEQQLRALAHQDPLTGAANRRWFDERAGQQLTLCRSAGQPLSVMVLDVDHFKAINDRYGHDTGDEVLKALAGQCQRTLSERDLLARFGGEEFVMLLPETTLEQARHKGEILRNQLAGIRIRIANGIDVGFTVSLGVASLSAEHADVRGLLKAADAALYRAKHGGRNRVCVAVAAGPAPAAMPRRVAPVI